MNGFVNNPAFYWGAHGYKAQLVDDLIYEDASGIYVVPAGFYTDFVTVPRIVWPIVSPIDDGCRLPAALHDYFCFLRGGDPYHLGPKATHTKFYEALRSQGVGRIKAYTMYLAVSSVGQAATEFTRPWEKQ